MRKTHWLTTLLATLNIGLGLGLGPFQTLAAASDIEIPEDWASGGVTPGTHILKMGASPDGKKSASLAEMKFSAEELEITPDKIGRAMWAAKEAEIQSGFTVKTERRTKTAAGEVGITSSQNEYNEYLETFVALSGNTAVILRLITKSTKIQPSKEPDLAKILKSWKISADPLDRK